MKIRITIAVALAFALALPPVAKAANDPLGSGAVRLSLDRAFVSFLAKDAIKLTAAQGARRKGTTIILPVTGGSMDPTKGRGDIEALGQIVFEGSRRKVPLRDIAVKTKHSPLVAKVGGSQLKVAASQKLSSKRAGFGSSFLAKALKLSAKAATRLNKKLRPKAPFEAGQAIGSLLSNAQPKRATVLESGKATLAFDPVFFAKLGECFVSVNPIFPAEHSGAIFSFPILIGSQVAPDGSEGTLRTGGTVELLQLGAGQVFWHEPWLDLGARSGTAEVDLEPSPVFPGKLGRVGLFAANGGSISSDPQARTIATSGIALALTAEAAASLNEAFAEGKGAFKAGEGAGTLSFTAQAQ